MQRKGTYFLWQMQRKGTYFLWQMQRKGTWYLIVVLPDIGDNIAYTDGLHFCCEEVYPYRNRKKV